MNTLLQNWQLNIQNLLQKPFSYFIGGILVIICSILFLFLPGNSELQNTLSQLEKTLSANMLLAQEIERNTKEWNTMHSELQEVQKIYGPRVNKIFPQTENIGELTRFLESFAVHLEKTGPMALSTIAYGVPRKVKNYFSLPVTLSFKANNVNFVKFMQMIKESGSLEEENFFENSPVRLMNVRSIDVSIPEFSPEQSDDEQLYYVDLEMDTFFMEK